MREEERERGRKGAGRYLEMNSHRLWNTLLKSLRLAQRSANTSAPLTISSLIYEKEVAETVVMSSRIQVLRVTS